MESSRILPVRRRKPRIILDSRFPFFKTLNAGDKGQLDCQLTLRAMEKFIDENDNEKIRYVFSVEKAEIIEDRARAA